VNVENNRFASAFPCSRIVLGYSLGAGPSHIFMFWAISVLIGPENSLITYMGYYISMGSEFGSSYLFCYTTVIPKGLCEFGNLMAQQVLLNSCPPQHVSLQRFRILKPSIWVTKPNIVSSPSVSTSAPLRCVSFCCNSSATSSVESNLPSSAKIFVKGKVSRSISILFH